MSLPITPECYGVWFGHGTGRHLYRVQGPTYNGCGPDGTGRCVEVCVHCSDSRVVQGRRPPGTGSTKTRRH